MITFTSLWSFEKVSPEELTKRKMKMVSLAWDLFDAVVFLTLQAWVLFLCFISRVSQSRFLNEGVSESQNTLKSRSHNLKSQNVSGSQRTLVSPPRKVSDLPFANPNIWRNSTANRNKGKRFPFCFFLFNIHFFSFCFFFYRDLLLSGHWFWLLAFFRWESQGCVRWITFMNNYETKLKIFSWEKIRFFGDLYY